jgi:hypothetical protein
VVHLHDRMVGLGPAYGLAFKRQAAPVQPNVVQAFC